MICFVKNAIDLNLLKLRGMPILISGYLASGHKELPILCVIAKKI